MNVLGVPVAGEALQHDLILRHALGEAEGAGADGVQAELVASGLGRLGRDHDAGAVGELGEQLRGGGLQVQLDRQRIDDVDAIDRADLATAHAAFGVEVAHQLVFRRLGVEFLAVLEEDVGTQVDHQVGGVFPLITSGELGDDVQLGVDVEQLVAQTGKDDAPDIGRAEGGVEQVRILAQTDVQGLGLGERGGGEAEDTDSGQDETAHHIPR